LVYPLALDEIQARAQAIFRAFGMGERVCQPETKSKTSQV